MIQSNHWFGLLLRSQICLINPVWLGGLLSPASLPLNRRPFGRAARPHSCPPSKLDSYKFGDSGAGQTWWLDWIVKCNGDPPCCLYTVYSKKSLSYQESFQNRCPFPCGKSASVLVCAAPAAATWRSFRPTAPGSTRRGNGGSSILPTISNWSPSKSLKTMETTGSL